MIFSRFLPLNMIFFSYFQKRSEHVLAPHNLRAVHARPLSTIRHQGSERTARISPPARHLRFPAVLHSTNESFDSWS